VIAGKTVFEMEMVDSEVDCTQRRSVDVIDAAQVVLRVDVAGVVRRGNATRRIAVRALSTVCTI